MNNENQKLSGLYEDEILKQFSTLLKMLEEEMELPSGFLERLNTEDDWSFIIKCHALIEASITNQLSSILDSRLTKVFQQLELGNSRKGKIAFAEALQLLDIGQRKFIRALSELRNKLVHDVKRVDFNLKDYLDSLDKPQRAPFLDALTYFTSTKEARTAWNNISLVNPKPTISFGTINILYHTVKRAVQDRVDKYATIEKLRMIDKLFKYSSGRNN